MNSEDDYEGEVGAVTVVVTNTDTTDTYIRPPENPIRNEVIMNKLVKYISPYDLNCCRQVCRLWRKEFSCTNIFLKNFRLRLRQANLKELFYLEETPSNIGSDPDISFRTAEIPWKSIIFEDDDEILTLEEELGMQEILNLFNLEELATITLKGYNTLNKNIFTRIIISTNNLTVLNIDWKILIDETLTSQQTTGRPNPDPENVEQSESWKDNDNDNTSYNNLSQLLALSINSCQYKARIPSRKMDMTLSQNLNVIFSNVYRLKSLSLLQGFSSFEKMKRSIESFKEILNQNTQSLHDLILDEAFFECLAHWPRLVNLKTFGVTLSSWEEQKFQLKVYMKYLVGQLTEFQFQSPHSTSHTNIFDLSGDGLSPMLVEYGQNLERLKLRSRIKVDTFPRDVAFIQSLAQLKELYFSGESPAHALLSYFTPGDELVAGLPLHLGKLYLRGFSIRNPFMITQLDQLTELCLNECKVRMEFFLVNILKPREHGGLTKLKILELWDYQKSHGPTDYHFTGIDHENNNSSEVNANSNNGMSEETQQNHAWSIVNLQALEKITLRRFEHIGDNLCIHGLQFLPSLKYLDLGFCDNITNTGLEAVIRGCPYLQEVYVDDEIDLNTLNGLREGRPVKVFGVSWAPIVVGNFIHNLLERIVELSSLI